eukprot:6899310-Lingulodinium_polyedra.AAC.1
MQWPPGTPWRTRGTTSRAPQVSTPAGPITPGRVVSVMAVFAPAGNRSILGMFSLVKQRGIRQ